MAPTTLAWWTWVQPLMTEIEKDPDGVKPQVVPMDNGFLIAYANACRDFYPDNFNSAGHGNGTFMMGRAMKLVPAVRFCHIFLAGSALPVDHK